MSKPSEEAKQAAEKIYHPDAKHLIHAFVQGYDTATAKVRKELEQWQEHAAALERELAHQQPSEHQAKGEAK